MCTSLISLFSSSAAKSAAGSASMTSSAIGLIDDGKYARGKTRRGDHEFTNLAFSWRWSKVRGSDGYGKYRVSIDDDNGVTVEYR